jgi:hypothetical protein
MPKSKNGLLEWPDPENAGMKILSSVSNANAVYKEKSETVKLRRATESQYDQLSYILTRSCFYDGKENA